MELPGACRPLTLDEAVGIALRANPELAAVRQQVEIAEAGRQIAFADLVPEARFTFREMAGSPDGKKFALPTMPTYVGNIAPADASDQFERAELSVQWLLWDFGSTSRKYDRSGVLADVARLRYRRAQQSVAFEVADAYYAVLSGSALRRIADEAIARAESVLRDAVNYRRRGAAVQNDVLAAEVLLADMRLLQIKAQTSEAAAVARLNRATGTNVSCPTRVVDMPIDPAFAGALSDCLQLAASNREEFRIVVDLIRASRLDVGVAKADFLPRVLVGGVGLQQDARGVSDVSMLAGGFNIDLGLFEGGRRVGKLRLAEAELRQAVAKAESVCDTIAYEVNLAYLAVADARQRVEVGRVAVAHATENFRVVRSQLAQGDTIPTESIDADLKLTRAKQDYFQALYDYQAALAGLEYAVGTPLQDWQVPVTRSSP